jgi:RimJ/RimL family protein N-acetyltransferase
MNITQRTATLEDASVLLTWRNDPSAREFSVHFDPIPTDEHMLWYSARLARVRLEPFFMFVVNHAAVGMSRLDRTVEFTDKYEISVLVDPNQHSKGIGTKILEMTCESFFKLHPEKSIIARVHKQNFTSQRLFIKAGFSPLNSTSDFLEFEKS